MSVTETAPDQTNGTGRPRRASLFSRAKQVEQIDGYHIGNLRTHNDITISANAAVAGDIIGQHVRILGKVYGFVIAQEVTIESGGELWGDLYTSGLTLKPGAALSGWTYTVDEVTILEYQASGQPPAPPGQPPALPDTLQEAFQAAQAEMPEDRGRLLRLIADEAATARLARLEIEQSFESRLRSIVGDRTEEIQQLKDEVELLRRERTSTRQKIGQLSASLQSKEEALAQLEVSLQEQEELATQNREEMIALEHDKEHLNIVVSELRDQREQISSELDAAKSASHTLDSRIENLEVALEKSQQRISEQVESLMHWQELVEVQENQAAELRERSRDFELTMTDNQKLVNSLREQREALLGKIGQLEAEVSNAQDGVAEQIALQVAEETMILKEDLDRKTKELELSKQALVESTALLSQQTQQSAELEKEIATSAALQGQLDALQLKLKQLEIEQSDRSEADLAEAQAELTETKQLNAEAQAEISLKDKLIRNLERALEDKENDLIKADRAFDEQKRTLLLTDIKLNEAIDAFRKVQSRYKRLKKKVKENEALAQGDLKGELEEKTVQLDLNAVRLEQTRQENEGLQGTIDTLKKELAALKEELATSKAASRDLQLRGDVINEAYERDLDLLNEQFQAQGVRLSEAQVRIVNQGMELNRLKEAAEKREQELELIRDRATKAVDKYKARLEEKEQALKALTK